MKNFIYPLEQIPYLREKFKKWRKIYDYTFEFHFWKEVWNTLGHIVFASLFAHVCTPYLSVGWITGILLFIGTAREVWQNIRGKYQPWLMSTVDSLSFGIGGYLWWLIITAYNINVDFL